MSETNPNPNPLSRRAVLGGMGALGAAAAANQALHLPAAAQSAAPHPATREAFDQMDLALNNGNATKDETNDKDSSGLSGKLAWREAYALLGYALMYQAHHDTYYLDKMVDHIDHVLANRDSERGVTDYAGDSHPAWRADHLYTIGFATLLDTAGEPILEIRTALSYGDDTSLTVTAGAAPGTFTLTGHNTFHNRTTLLEDLSTDPVDENYAPKRMLEGFRYESPNRLLLTVRELREQPTAGDEVALGTFSMLSAPYVYSAHTGSIVHPIAMFARIVREDPDLLANPTYAQRAELYLAAAADAIAVHDSEFRVNEVGEGYYIAQAGAPVWNAGFDNALGHFTPLARATIEMARVTGDQAYIDRANAMGLTVRNAMIEDGRAWIWPSWWQKGAPYNGWDIDDPRSDFQPWYLPNRIIKNTSHAQYDANFALELHQADLPGQPFTDADMARFAATFTDNMAILAPDGTPSVTRLVDGSGGVGTRGQEQQSTSLANFCRWDPQILDHCIAMLQNHQQLNLLKMESAMYCVAQVNLAAAQA